MKRICSCIFVLLLVTFLSKISTVSVYAKDKDMVTVEDIYDLIGDFKNYDNPGGNQEFLQGKKMMKLCSYGTPYDTYDYTRMTRSNQPYYGAFSIYAVNSGSSFMGVSVTFCSDPDTFKNDDYTCNDVFTWGPLTLNYKSGTFKWNPTYRATRGYVKNGDDRSFDGTLANVKLIGDYKFSMDGGILGYADDLKCSGYGGDEHPFDVKFCMNKGCSKAVTGQKAQTLPFVKDFLEDGVCPEYAYVSVVDAIEGSLDGVKGLVCRTDDLMLSHSKSDFRDGFDYIPGAKNDQGSVLSFSKFRDDSVYKIDYNMCLQEDNYERFSKLYGDLFTEIETFAANNELLRMYKGKGVCKIAQKVKDNNQLGSSCGIHDEDLYKRANKILSMKFCNDDRETPIDESKCESYLGDINENGSPAYYFDKIFRFMTYAAVLVLITITTVEYIKCLSSDDKDALKKLNVKTVKRLIFTILIFLLPYLLRIILPIFKITSDCSSANIGG